MNNFSFEEVGIKLPTFQEIEDIDNFLNLKAMAKFRHHESGWTWYVIAGKPRGNDMLLYCFVDGDFKEFGNVLLSEILNVGAMFCPTFQPVYIKELID